MDEQAIAQLGGFALGEVLQQLDLDADALSSVQDQFGIGRAEFSKESIYRDNFVDAYDDEPIDEATDLEAQVDRELADSKWQKKGAQAVGASTTLLRGEEDDFDEDDEDAEGEADGETVELTEKERREGALGGQDMIEVTVKRADEEDDNYDDESDAGDDLFGDGDDDDEPVPAGDGMDIDGQAQSAAAAAAGAPSPAAEVAEPPPMKKVDIKECFPRFENGKVLDFTELFSARPRKKQKKVSSQTQLELPAADELVRVKSTRDTLVQPMRAQEERSRLRALLIESQTREREEWEDEGSSDEELIKAIEASNRQRKHKFVFPEHGSETFANAELDRWEDSIVWGAGFPAPANPMADPGVHRNADFERGDWIQSIIWDAHKPYKPFSKLNLNLNDTEMILEVQSTAKVDTAGPGPAPKPVTLNPVQREPGLDPFNVSNDKEYEHTREAKKKIRQTFGLLEVKHAYPAEKLQLPFYKTQLTKQDTRAFHRAPISIPAGVQYSFTKSKSSKKKKDATGRKIKRGDGDAFRHMSDITLKDTSPFVLWEYSEEKPPIISNVGMGSIIVNYYRKTSAEDSHVPQLDIGEPFLLEGTDESPFKTFGHVEPGQTVTAIYNNLIRAPIFKHEPAPTDFLVVRVTIGSDVKYYLREIKTSFVVGQTYPVSEVPGPHSRKITSLVKNRLQIIAFKLVAKDENNRIKVHRLTRYFPDQNDLQMRQRLKEFMAFNRKGDHQGYWKVKDPASVPDEAEMIKLATPEMVCLAEAMHVGVRQLTDAGYGGEAAEGGAGDDDSKLTVEQQLAPWITTKNFINATANKAMLKLHGEGDPTGRGEAFSFLRVSMKDIFLRAGERMEDRLALMKLQPKSAHKYNVSEQQDIYKEEIARIWKVQFDSLSNPKPPELTAEDELRARGGKERHGHHGHKTGLGLGLDSAAGTPREPFTRAGSAGSDGEGDDHTSVASTSRAGGAYAAGGQDKTLRIRRFVGGQWTTELVRDQAVIKAYIRQRQLIDEERTDADEMLPSDDSGKNERMRKRLKEQLEKLKRNQERRLQRKNQKMGIAIGEIGAGGKKNVKTETTRVCGNCGQRGHMKTSRKLCPRWAEFNQPKAAEPSGALPSSFASGLALPSMGQVPVRAPAPKPTIKLKLGGAGAGSPPAS